MVESRRSDNSESLCKLPKSLLGMLPLDNRAAQPKHPVAQDHLQVQREMGDQEEKSLGPLKLIPGDNQVVVVLRDPEVSIGEIHHQGKEVPSKRF